MEKTDFMKLIIDNVSNFKGSVGKRYLSWEYCYEEFYKAIEDVKNGKSIDNNRYLYLSLHLAFYLASWGMYRGSSFLLKFDYKVHLPTVKLILNEKYSSLLCFNRDKTAKNYNQNLELLFGKDGNEGLVQEIKDIYLKLKLEVKNSKNNSTIVSVSDETDAKENSDEYVSEILVSKILLGTLGCVPAYDTMLKRALKSARDDYGLKICSKFGKKSIESIVGFCNDMKKLLDNREKIFLENNVKIEYPLMKILDMGLWEIGKQEIDKEKEGTK